MTFVYTTTLLITVVAALLVFNMYRKAHTDFIDERVLPIQNFPSSFDGVRIFFISDIHRRILDNHTIHAISSIDLVIIAGDLMERGVPMENVRENITRLKQLNAPLYFIWGNNDYEGDYHDLDALLLDEGVHILGNSAVEFESETGDTFNVLGIDPYLHHEGNSGFAFEGANSKCKIMVIHDPSIFEQLPQEQQEQVDLVLSGHTHGGQIRFMGLGLSERGGLKTVNGIPVFISEGYGTRLIPFRLGTRAECHILTITG
ncbi:putative MPP superfamily phosphohydrolase [Thalassobacillus devorans]|nr:metallophosphoesterase [Thalassobacillus devorans]NIK28337.1 putative MPP superfamily phosphohydrolase [Thalassobacillus devorans]